MFWCDSCGWTGAEVPGQSELRERRIRKDWEEVTVPVNFTAIQTDEMAEQYPGAARQAIRAFEASEAEFATVPDLDASILQSSIATLGLHKKMYAEIRDGTTVLRRIESQEKRRARSKN